MKRFELGRWYLNLDISGWSWREGASWARQLLNINIGRLEVQIKWWYREPYTHDSQE